MSYEKSIKHWPLRSSSFIQELVNKTAPNFVEWKWKSQFRGLLLLVMRLLEIAAYR